MIQIVVQTGYATGKTEARKRGWDQKLKRKTGMADWWSSRMRRSLELFDRSGERCLGVVDDGGRDAHGAPRTFLPFLELVTQAGSSIAVISRVAHRPIVLAV